MYCYWHPSAAIYIGIAHTTQHHRKNKLIARECPGCFVFPFEEAANFCKRFLGLEQFSPWKGKASFGHFWVFALYMDDSSWRPYGSGDSEILSQPTCQCPNDATLLGCHRGQVSATPAGHKLCPDLSSTTRLWLSWGSEFHLESLCVLQLCRQSIKGTGQ